jgi:uncharacterized LabA/DUF88 family protein
VQKVSIFIDGYNLYHSIKTLNKPILKWTNPLSFCKFFTNIKEEEVCRVKFFTAFPHHKPKDVQDRYITYTKALKAYKIEIIEGEFKKKISSFYSDGKKYTRSTFEEKESDVNLSIAIVEDAFEKISDKILVITNDSDIAPAIKMAKEKNSHLKIQVVSPPLAKTKQISYSLYVAAGSTNRNKKGQTYVKTAQIKEFMLNQAIMPAEIIFQNEVIKMPQEYLVR